MSARKSAAPRPLIDLDGGNGYKYGYRDPMALDGPEFTPVSADEPTDAREPADATGCVR
jgi:hypothetical protein